MYQVDEKDCVVPLTDVPQSSIGAPVPVVVADEHRVVLAYYLDNRDPAWDGTYVRLIDRVSDNEPIALICFSSCSAHMFGPPNDEAFEGHPLAARGLSAYRAFRIEHSSWIRQLERMNSVHPYHRAECFDALSHFVFAFHDSTFECVCESFQVGFAEGSLLSVMPRMTEMLGWKALE
jgi:hypothetical protein